MIRYISSILQVADAVGCPFQDESGGCRASTSGMPLSRGRRKDCCTTDDYDDCAIYLAKFLRTGRPAWYGRESRELALK